MHPCHAKWHYIIYIIYISLVHYCMEYCTTLGRTKFHISAYLHLFFRVRFLLMSFLLLTSIHHLLRVERVFNQCQNVWFNALLAFRDNPSWHKTYSNMPKGVTTPHHYGLLLFSLSPDLIFSSSVFSSLFLYRPGFPVIAAVCHEPQVTIATERPFRWMPTGRKTFWEDGWSAWITWLLFPHM